MMEDSSEKVSNLQIIEGLEAKQRNIVFPDTLRNARGVDEYLWKGSPVAPLVQRLGAWIFGISFVIVGLALLGIACDKQIWQPTLFSLLSLSIGLRIIASACRTTKSRGGKKM